MDTTVKCPPLCVTRICGFSEQVFLPIIASTYVTVATMAALVGGAETLVLVKYALLWSDELHDHNSLIPITTNGLNQVYSLLLCTVYLTASMCF